jgi:dTDP-4-amino-4,6-dideoxygalactose transaminase
MWGNPENMRELRQLAHEKNLNLVEDACLALGAVADGRPAGSWGDVGVFSFGNMKPIQTGEGGMIVTNDEALARELRALRHWGDRTIEFGVRDVTEVAWNGRMSEIVAAVAREQLKGYPKHLGQLRESVSEFQATLPEYAGLSLTLGTAESISCSALTQVVLRIDEALLGVTKKDLMAGLTENGIPNWHANFELISSLSVFRSDHWLEWILRGDVERARQNNSGPFPVAQRVYDETGIGLRNTNFLSSGNRKYLQSVLHSLLKRTKA